MSPRPRLPILGLAGMLGVAGLVGIVIGLRATPPGETEIINAVATAYADETGGDVIDCFARPSALVGVRLVVICDPAEAVDDGDARAYPVDRWGRPVDVEAADLAADGQT